MKLVVRGVFMGLVLSLAALNASAETVRFPSVAVDNSPVGPTISAWVYRPASAGPAPAVIYAHTCGGLDSFSELMAKKLASWGYFVIAPDNFSSRGIKNACSGGVPANNLVSDVAGALDFLASRPEVVQGKVAIVGDSAGGKLALRAVQRRFNLANRGLVGGVGLYLAPCSAPQDKFVALPFLALMAEKDDWTAMAECHAFADAAPKPPLQAIFYPNAMHGFDNSVEMNRAVPCAKGTCHLVYDAKVAADADARTRTFLQSVLGR